MANTHEILYCQKMVFNTKAVYIGAAGVLQHFLAANPNVLTELNILRLTHNGFVSRSVDGNGKVGREYFGFPDRSTRCALYTNVGWEEMACITIWEQFIKDRKLGMRHGAVYKYEPMIKSREVKLNLSDLIGDEEVRKWSTWSAKVCDLGNLADFKYEEDDTYKHYRLGIQFEGIVRVFEQIGSLRMKVCR